MVAHDEDSEDLPVRPELVRQLSTFAEEIEHENLLDAIEGDKAQEGDNEAAGKRRSCGLPAFVHSREAETNFANILQRMIERTLRPEAPKTSLEKLAARIRIFEDHTFKFKLGTEGSATFSECRSTQFRRLRAAAGIAEEEYMKSLCSQPFKGHSGQGGKSGALFLKSQDDRYILKTIEEHEFICLKDILPNYLLYLEENRSSLLSRFYGAYALTIGRVTLRVVVMNNCLRGEQCQIYDLKGTTEDRWVDPSLHAVLKDNNFSPHVMLFDAAKVQQFRAAIQDDAEFLESCGLMDYSLLVGVASEPPVGDGDGAAARSEPGLAVHHGWLRTGDGSPEPRFFQFGIIDYLQRWTPKKVAAHWMKKFTIGCINEIDTEPPHVYCARFYKYFTTKILPAAA